MNYMDQYDFNEPPMTPMHCYFKPEGQEVIDLGATEGGIATNVRPHESVLYTIAVPDASPLQALHESAPEWVSEAPEHQGLTGVFIVVRYPQKGGFNVIWNPLVRVFSRGDRLAVSVENAGRPVPPPVLGVPDKAVSGKGAIFFVPDEVNKAELLKLLTA